MTSKIKGQRYHLAFFANISICLPWVFIIYVALTTSALEEWTQTSVIQCDKLSLLHYMNYNNSNVNVTVYGKRLK